jgi:dextranase
VTAVVVRQFGPSRPSARPGSIVTIEVELEASSPQGRRVAASIELLDVDRVVLRRKRRVRLDRGPVSFGVRMRLPAAPRHGYGLRLAVEAAGRRVVATSAVEAIQGWWESPRHAALTRFGAPDRAAAAVKGLRDWHVNVVQAYDWMYRHYQYEPTARGTFRDTLGRVVSHDAVRGAVRAGRKDGIATLAYGSVYGAEPEYVAAHPDEGVFDDAGEALSLGGMFYITDLRPGSPWRKRLLAEYARACRRFGFDGIHMDTYGPPHGARAADGEQLRFAELYPGLIREADAVVRRTHRERRVLFNCVEGFPLESVAPAPTAAIYLELWPPDDRYADVVQWIERARAVANGRAIVIAAYLSALREAGADRKERARAVEAAVLLTTLIAAAGAYHHVIAEGNRLLVEGYYPAARSLRRREADELRAAWRFTARYLHLLSDATLVPSPEDVVLADDAGEAIPTRLLPEAGAVWVRSVRTPSGKRVLHLVDLRSQSDDRWDAPREAPRTVTGWTLTWPGGLRPVAASPWSRGGLAVTLRREGGPARQSGSWRLPPFRRWLMVADGVDGPPLPSGGQGLKVRPKRA